MEFPKESEIKRKNLLRDEKQLFTVKLLSIVS